MKDMCACGRWEKEPGLRVCSECLYADAIIPGSIGAKIWEIRKIHMRVISEIAKSPWQVRVLWAIARWSVRIKQKMEGK